MFIRTQTNGPRTYLLLVENERIKGRLVQRMLHRFGRLGELRALGQLDTLVQSLGRFAEKIVALDAHAKGEMTATQTVTVGPGFEAIFRSMKSVLDTRPIYHQRDDTCVCQRNLAPL